MNCFLYSLYFFAFCYRCAPQLFAGIYALLYQMVGRKEYRQLQSNVERILGLAKHSAFHRGFVRQVIEMQAHLMMETLLFRLWRVPLEIDGEKHFASLAKELGGKFLIVSAHLGAWELLAEVTARHCSLSVLAKAPRSSFLKKNIEKLRVQGGYSVIWVNDDDAAKNMLSAVRSGQVLGFVADQKPHHRQGTVVPFFGIDVPFVNGPESLGRKFHLPMVAAYLVRTGPMRYTLKSYVLGEQRTRAMAADFERMIRIYPEQWTWSYKRWT